MENLNKVICLKVINIVRFFLMEYENYGWGRKYERDEDEELFSNEKEIS